MTVPYRSIPLGSYKTIFHESYPGITVRGTSGPETATEYFYAVNTAPETRTVRIQAGGKMEERTRFFGGPLQRDGETWRFELEPYAIRVFEIADGRLGGIEAE